MTTSGAEHFDRRRLGGRRESLDEQVRRRGLKPIESVDDLACDGVFDTDEELDAFLAHVYAERHANLAQPPADYVVLDTDVASLSFRGRLPAGFRRPLAGKLTCVSFVTIGKMTKWAELRDWGPRNRERLELWLSAQVHL